MATLTKAQHRRKMLRTTFQALVGICALAPVLVTQTGLKLDQIPWLVPVLAITAAVTRVMNTPKVEAFLKTNAPWLASGE